MLKSLDGMISSRLPVMTLARRLGVGGGVTMAF